MSKRVSRIVRFIISGAIATGLTIGLLYVFTKYFHIWYLVSSIAAFVIATANSFILQKYWAFKNNRSDIVRKQAAEYIILQTWDLLFNTLLLFVAVNYAHLWYLLAQFCSSVIIAAQNYFVYRLFIFKDSPDTKPVTTEV